MEDRKRVFMIKIVTNIEEANCITHAGHFHADDIFATIFLEKVKGDILLYRANQLSNNTFKDKIVFDIGFGEFDHHQEKALTRENGLKYCAFGLLFEKFGKDYIRQLKVDDVEKAYNMFLREFVLQIDAIDNGVFLTNPKDYTVSSLAEVVEYFNPTWCEHTSLDEAFLEAIAIFQVIWNRIEKRIIDKLAASFKVLKEIEKSREGILILPEYMPFMDTVLTSDSMKAQELFFAVFPSNRGGYSVQAIHKQIGSYENRLDFPLEWGGKSKEELVFMTGIETFYFCHKGLFCASCDTLEDALMVARLAIKKRRP